MTEWSIWAKCIDSRLHENDDIKFLWIVLLLSKACNDRVHEKYSISSLRAACSMGIHTFNKKLSLIINEAAFYLCVWTVLFSGLLRRASHSSQ
ncbi:MAG: hypothetical protein LBP54_01005 [Campylobacteraceae bacterium]|jgi:hypothetical protein|nr:hypothetical protein [Campylobacteraceae bacterium]